MFIARAFWTDFWRNLLSGLILASALNLTLKFPLLEIDSLIWCFLSRTFSTWINSLLPRVKGLMNLGKGTSFWIFFFSMNLSLTLDRVDRCIWGTGRIFEFLRAWFFDRETEDLWWEECLLHFWMLEIEKIIKKMMKSFEEFISFIFKQNCLEILIIPRASSLNYLSCW